MIKEKQDNQPKGQAQETGVVLKGSNEINLDVNTDVITEESKEEKQEREKTGTIYVGQKWVELHGAFTFNELRSLADRVEKSFNKAFKKK